MVQTSQTLSDQLYPHYVANVPVHEWQATPPAQFVSLGSPADPATPRAVVEGRLNFTRFKQDVNQLQRDRVNDSQQQQIEASVTDPNAPNTTVQQQESAEDQYKRLQEEMRTLRQQQQQQEQPDLDQVRAEEALYLEKQGANELQQKALEQAQALEKKRCAEEKLWREERQMKLEEVRDEREAAVSDKGNIQLPAPAPAEEDVMRGRDAVLQAVLTDLHRARDKLQACEAKVAASEAEVTALRAEMGGSGDAVGRAHAKAMELEALRTELREARSTAQHQGDLVQMRDVEIASLRKELREARTVQPQCSPSRNVEAEERCKMLEIHVDRLQAELSLKDSKLQEAWSTASCSQQAEERCKTLQSQMELLEVDLSAKNAKLQEALQSRAAEGSLAAHHAEEQCKVLEAQVQELQANLTKATARCTELESNAERPRTRRGMGDDSGCHAPVQTPTTAEAAVDRAGKSGSSLASALQSPASSSSGNRSARLRQEVREASTVVNAASDGRYEELRQLRQEGRQAPTSTHAPPAARYEELMKLRKALVSGGDDA